MHVCHHRESGACKAVKAHCGVSPVATVTCWRVPTEFEDLVCGALPLPVITRNPFRIKNSEPNILQIPQMIQKYHRNHIEIRSMISRKLHMGHLPSQPQPVLSSVAIACTRHGTEARRNEQRWQCCQGAQVDAFAGEGAHVFHQGTWWVGLVVCVTCLGSLVFGCDWMLCLVSFVFTFLYYDYYVVLFVLLC